MERLEAELLATLSHELRGPLASVQGYTATQQALSNSWSERLPTCPARQERTPCLPLRPPTRLE